MGKKENTHQERTSRSSISSRFVCQRRRRHMATSAHSRAQTSAAERRLRAKHANVHGREIAPVQPDAFGMEPVVARLAVGRASAWSVEDHRS